MTDSDDKELLQSTWTVRELGTFAKNMSKLVVVASPETGYESKLKTEYVRKADDGTVAVAVPIHSASSHDKDVGYAVVVFVSVPLFGDDILCPKHIIFPDYINIPLQVTYQKCEELAKAARKKIMFNWGNAALNGIYDAQVTNYDTYCVIEPRPIDLELDKLQRYVSNIVSGWAATPTNRNEQEG